MTRADEIVADFSSGDRADGTPHADDSVAARKPASAPTDSSEAASQLEAARLNPAGSTSATAQNGNGPSTNGHRRGHEREPDEGRRLLHSLVEHLEPATHAGAARHAESSDQSGAPTHAERSTHADLAPGSAEPEVLDEGSFDSRIAQRLGGSDEIPEGASERHEEQARPVTPAADEHADSEDVTETPHHESLPNMARAAAGTWLKAAGWTAGTSLRVSNQLMRLAADPSAAQEVIEEVAHEVREVARDFLGITELDAEVQQMAPLLSSGLLKAGGSSPAALRAQGEALLRAAANVGFDESAHPAFARILTELSPDEARILRLLAIEGSQPMVDVRAHNLIGNGSQLIAQSLNMLGSKAGLRQRERVPVYLTNLVRLNLIVLSDESLDSIAEYQVLEAQPEVMATLRDTPRAKTVRRSVLLTPLGQEFCDVCLPVQLPALPPPSDD